MSIWKTVYYLNAKFDLLFVNDRCISIETGGKVQSGEYYSQNFPFLFLALNQLAYAR